ncbi:hypothetical protein Tco_0828616 [Tanacetum coccineum]
MSGSDVDSPPPPPPPSQTPTQQTPHTVSTIKLPILKKGEYDIWAMKMEHYLAHTDYPIWEVIQNGNGLVSISIDTQGQIRISSPHLEHPRSPYSQLHHHQAHQKLDLYGLKEDKICRMMRGTVHERKVSTEDALNIAQPKVSTDKEEVSTDRPEEGTDKQKVSTNKEEVSTDRPDEGIIDQIEGRSATQTTPQQLYNIRDDETHYSKYLKKTKAYLTRSLVNLKPLPRLIPKTTGRKKIKKDVYWEAADAESKDIMNLKRSLRCLLMMWRLQERIALRDWQFTMEESSNTSSGILIAAQRRFFAEQRAAAIRNKPHIRTQLKSQMMTYLKHAGNKKHSDLKNKTFEEIQALYEKVKRFDESFTTIGSSEDERKIKEY